MLTLQEISDHIEITRVLQLYSDILDNKQYTRFDQVFAENAIVDYEVGAMRSGVLPYRHMVDLLRMFNDGFLLTQRMMGHPLIDLEGDSARSKGTLRAMHVQEDVKGRRNTWMVYGVYHDIHTRTKAGWRILERVFRSQHTVGELVPPGQVRLPPAVPPPKTKYG